MAAGYGRCFSLSKIMINFRFPRAEEAQVGVRGCIL